MGTIRHETLEKASEIEEGMVSKITTFLDIQEIVDIYKRQYIGLLRKVISNHKKSLAKVNIDTLEAFKRSLPSILVQSQSRASNVHHFMSSHKVVAEELWDKLTPKISSEVRIESDELQLKGIIDQIHHYPDQDVPFELKTGKAPLQGVWPGHKIQLIAYTMMLEDKFNKHVDGGYIHYLDINEKRKITINPFMKEEVKQLTQEVIELLGNRLLPDFVDNRNKCKSCGLRDDCYNNNKMEQLSSLPSPR